MSYNTFGTAFRFTTWGESHGPCIGCIVDGAPPRIPLCEADIQGYLDLRRPGSSSFTTQRNEPDTARIVSGVFEGMTTGTPIAIIIENQDTRSKDYGDIAQTFRPGHADYTYFKKYGHRDYRGGGRSSARETAMRVAAGAVARKILGDGVRITGAMIRMGKSDPVPSVWNTEEINRNPFFCPDRATAERWEKELPEARKRGSSLGAVIEIRAEGVPSGLGAPLYRKLDSDLAAALMSINAVKGVEIGDGFASAELYGEENADEMIPDPESPEGVAFLSNHAGGILGGISTGAPIVARFAVKPTSSILIPRKSVTSDLEPADVFTKGRHDPCVGIRAVPVGEAMVACVLADHLLLHRAQCG